MALSASGAISADDIRTEYGLSGAVSFADLYRGGSYVRQKAANNLADNLASNVPTSGALEFDDFRGTAKGFKYTFTTGATDQDASALFGTDYGVNYPKEIVINSGVELGATSTSQEALEIDSGGSGTITITNNGTLSGAGGAAGADGGDAFEAAVTCSFVNNGTVRAGGGGGGTGGTGGNGSYSSTNYYYNSSTYYWYYNCGTIGISFAGNYTGFAGYWWQTSYGNYRRGTLQSGTLQECGASSRFQIGLVSNVSTSGGSGGGGAVGAGYNQSAGTGSAGSAGGTNAGTGGIGGNGGGFGASGSAGATGANGNSSNGSVGVSGGTAGKYLRGSSFVTFTNNGTAQGGTA
jgi:hypothetical protein